MTPEGAITRELTEDELYKFASKGDMEARKEILSLDIFKAASDSDRIKAILRYIGI